MDTTTITDPELLRVLATAQQTRAHCLSMLQFLQEHKQPPQQTSTTTPPEPDRIALSRLQKELTSHLALLRGHHRRAVYSARASKTLTSQFKSEIDSLHLSLQNLFYEQRHLSGEIQGCEDYPHSYTSLSLQDEDEFLERMAVAAGKVGGGRDKWEFKEGMSAHEYMVVRIKDEKDERQRLEKERLDLVKRKTELARRNDGLRKELEKVDKEAETWLDGRLRVEKLFEDKLGKQVKTVAMEVDVA